MGCRGRKRRKIRTRHNVFERRWNIRNCVPSAFYHCMGKRSGGTGISSQCPILYTIIHNTQRDQGLYRPPKQSEVTTVLEAAITSPNVFSSKERIQFTSTLSPENARDKFLALSPHFVQRNEMTVLDFKNRLSSFWDE